MFANYNSSPWLPHVWHAVLLQYSVRQGKNWWILWYRHVGRHRLKVHEGLQIFFRGPYKHKRKCLQVRQNKCFLFSRWSEWWRNCDAIDINKRTLSRRRWDIIRPWKLVRNSFKDNHVASRRVWPCAFKAQTRRQNRLFWCELYNRKWRLLNSSR